MYSQGNCIDQMHGRLEKSEGVKACMNHSVPLSHDIKDFFASPAISIREKKDCLPV